MKNTLINILILILVFNLIMIIFPDGKTQKFSRNTIKIFIMIYILDNIFLNGSINTKLLYSSSGLTTGYERSINIKSLDNGFIDELNSDKFNGEDVIDGITLNFDQDMNIKAKIYIKESINLGKREEVLKYLSDVLKVSSDNIELLTGGEDE